MIDYRENAKWTVYIHTIPKEISGYDFDKRYIGITSQDVNKRWDKGRGYRGQLFGRAINKYSWENIEHEIIASNLTESEAKDFEMKLIKTLQTKNNQYGYNITDGGDGVAGFGLYGEDHPASKKVFKFNLDGTYIDTYVSCTEAEKSIGHRLNKGNILRSIQTKGTCGGFLWGYEEDIFIDDNGNISLLWEYNPNKIKIVKEMRIYQFDKNTYSFIKMFNNQKEINEFYEKKCGDVNACVNNRRMTAYKSIWRYEKDIVFIDNIPSLPPEYITAFQNYKSEHIRKINSKKCAVYQFDLDFNFIKKYSSCIDAERETGTSRVSECANNIQVTSGNYIWRYEKDIEIKNNIPIIKDVNNIKNRIKKKSVSQYSFTGEYINTYISSVEAAKETNGNADAIGQVSRGLMRQSGGYIWRFTNEVTDENGNVLKIIEVPDMKPNKRSKNIYQFSLDKKFIDKYNSYKDANEKTNVPRGSIRDCATGRQKTSYGFIWKFEKDVIERDGSFFIAEN